MVRAARIQSQWVGLQSLAGPVCCLLHPQCWWQDLGWASAGGRRQLCWCVVLLPSWSSRMKPNYSLDHFSMPTSSPVPWDFLLLLMSLGSLPSSQTPFWSCSVFFPCLNLLPALLPSHFSPHYCIDTAVAKSDLQGPPCQCPMDVLLGRRMCMRAMSLQSCPTVCGAKDCSPSGSSVHGILQARIQEWVAMPSSRGSSWPRDWIRFSYVTWIRQVGSLPLAPPEKCHPEYCSCHLNFTL